MKVLHEYVYVLYRLYFSPDGVGGETYSLIMVKYGVQITKQMVKCNSMRRSPLSLSVHVHAPKYQRPHQDVREEVLEDERRQHLRLL